MTSPRNALTGREFQRRLRWLVLVTWNIPPVFGLSVIILIGTLTPREVYGILVTPLEPGYIIGWSVFSFWFLPRALRPVGAWLDGLPGAEVAAAEAAVRRFPRVFWTTFLIYLVLAPASVIIAAERYTGFVSTPMDWFRIELVALIVSIIVGLPIFFKMLDLFGLALGAHRLVRPIITVRTKVFLVGALVPLLIDTMLIQYYWTRTGYFSVEAFGVWALLELIAIGGSIVFAQSFGQSLAPLQSLSRGVLPLTEEEIAGLSARSTDELGVLTGTYRRVLEDLRAQTGQVRVLMDATEEGIYGIDLDGNCTFVNAAALRALGYRDEHDMLGRNVHALIHHTRSDGRPYPAAECSVRLAVRAGSTFHSDDELHWRADGSSFPVETWARPIFRNGAVAGSVVSFVDVGKRKDAEAALVQEQVALRESERRYRALVTAVPGAVYTFRLDPAGRHSWLFVSDGIVGLTGFPPQALLEDPDFAFRQVPPEHLPALRRSITESATRLSPWVFDLPFRSASGEERWLAGRSQPFREADGSTIWHGVLVDDTERVRAAESRRSLEAQLRQSQKMDALGNLAGGIAHDFNNLLTIISGSAEEIGDSLAPGSALRPVVDDLQLASERAAALTRQILSFSRRQPQRRVPLDLNVVVASMRPLLGRLALTDITITMRLAETPVRVEADPAQLEQVILNLAVNARDAMPDGGTLTFETTIARAEDVPSIERSGLGAGRYGVLTVRDTGVGMVHEVRERIFEPFFTTKEPGRGTGLGLSIAYGIVSQGGGRIFVDSAPGDGACFRVLLPESDVIATEPTAADALPHGHETVLVVDDEPAIRELTRRSLESLGYVVHVAEGGDEAFAWLERHEGTTDLILSDVMMPGGGGRQLAERVQARWPGHRVLFMSGFATDLGLQELLDRGTAHFLSKPFSRAELARRVRAVLDAAPR
jgi:PAS domain S-box-containing protein